jgi:hypothetical protein
MKNKQGWLRIFQIIGLVLALGVNMSAEAGLFGFGGTSWKEEVLLHDGSKVIVERTVELGGRHEIGQEPPIKEQSLTFTMPGSNQRVVWKDEFSEDVGSANFLPMQLEVAENIAYLVATPMGCLSYNKWGRPNPPYVVFKYQGNEWKRIPLQELPSEFNEINLSFSSPHLAAKETIHGLLTAEQIKKWNSSGMYHPAEYRSIVREPVVNASQGCTEMIHINNGWEGLGFFKHQPSYEACLKYCDQQGVSSQNCPCTTLFKGK